MFGSTKDDAMDIDEPHESPSPIVAQRSPVTGSGLDNSLRRSGRKRKTPPPASGKDRNPRPYPRKKVKKEAKRGALPPTQSKGKSQYRNYFEEVEVNGASRFREVYDLTEMMVCFLLQRENLLNPVHSKTLLNRLLKS
jgi:hypothetical protein